MLLLSKTDDATNYLERALELDQNSSETRNNLRFLYQTIGDERKAIENYNKPLELKPDFAQTYYSLSSIKKYSNDDRIFIDKILSLLSNDKLNENDEILLLFAIGKIYNDCKRHNDSLKYFKKCNKLKYRSCHADLDLFRCYIDDVINAFNSKLIKFKSRFGSNSDRPVFIVSMPRSDTTIVEQIIASHPKVFRAGELQFIGNIPEQITNYLSMDKYSPKCIEKLDPKITKLVANNYLNKLNHYSSKAGRIMDKMPQNLVHLWLINILFSHSKIIYCNRDPFDICLSIYFQNFIVSNGYTYDLADIAHRYQQYVHVFTHWKKHYRLQY